MSARLGCSVQWNRTQTDRTVLSRISGEHCDPGLGELWIVYRRLVDVIGWERVVGGRKVRGWVVNDDAVGDWGLRHVMLHGFCYSLSLATRITL